MNTVQNETEVENNTSILPLPSPEVRASIEAGELRESREQERNEAGTSRRIAPKRGIFLSWQNVSRGSIGFLRKDYNFPFLNL